MNGNNHRPSDGQHAPSAQKSYLSLSSEEPFRVFFPLGMLLGVVGILLWPLFYGGLIEAYPLSAHLRLMIHGFLGSFVFGFLFTAGPRLLSCPRPNQSIIEGFLIISLLQAIFAFSNPIAADALFLFQLSTAFVLALQGFKLRGDLPPPGFVLGIAGLLSAIAGAALMLICDLGKGGTISYQLSKLLLFQAFPALPLVGIGAFFFPKLARTPNPQDLPENPRPTAAWLKRAAYAMVTALLFAVSIVIEIKGHHKEAYLLRAFSLAAYLCLETPILTRPRGENSQLMHILCCSAAIVISFALIALYPAQKTAWLHGFFICGLSGSILLVATRVIFGHSGNFVLAMKSRKPLLLAILALLIAAGSRISADFWPEIRITHHVYSAAFWLLVAAVWLAKVGPKVTIEDTED